MKVIRRGVFETNSSSTHSITMCAKEDYDRWVAGEVLYCDGSFITKETAIAEIKEDSYFQKKHPNFDWTDQEAVDQILRQWGYSTHEKYFDDEYLEGFDDTYTTKNGEVVVAFGKYGYDG